MPKLREMAKKVPAWGALDQEDLVQAAVIRLMRARQIFDPSKSKWSTYALNSARGGMLDALRDLDHVPRLERARARKDGRTLRALHSLDGGFVDVRKEGLPILRDTAAERLDFWRTIRQRLPGKLGQVVDLYFRENRTLKEIGRIVGLSESRCCQLLAHGLRELRWLWGAQEVAR